MVYLLAAPRVQLSVSADSGWPHNFVGVSLAHANQLPLWRLYSAAVLESDSSKRRYSYTQLPQQIALVMY